MENFLADHGLPALFLLSFLASTVIPLGSEWLVVTLILKSYQPEYVVAVATAGNYLGACTTYFVGLWGAGFLIKKVMRIDEASLARAQLFYRRYGSWSLLFSWLPVIGDPLCLAGGALRINFILFSLLVFAGKLARYAVIAAVTASAMR
ncbi:MAG: DedA family protein [Proteobacteria bacterium]|nr:DedA family protein [Pseudomonadota bacterium]MBU0965885.1 DedA family protein [Pseudomonadota bacterium]